MSKILGLVVIGLLLIAVLAGLGLIKNPATFFSRADVTSAASEIKVSNLSDNSFTVSWITQKPVIGYVSYGENKQMKSIQYDDRDRDGIKARLTHFVTLKKLKPSTMYYYSINKNSASAVTTAQTTSIPPLVPFPVYGKVLKQNGQASDDVLVYFKAENGTLLSSYVDTQGNWLITLNNARTSDLSNYLIPTQTMPSKIDFQGSIEGKNSITGTIKQAQPLSTVKLQ